AAQVAARDGDTAGVLRVGARDVVPYRGEVERAVQDLAELQRAGWRLVLTTEGPGPARRMVEQLGSAEVPAHLTETLETEPEAGAVVGVPARAGSGFAEEAVPIDG